MVDVDRRLPLPGLSHAAALRRLSTRAAASPSSSLPRSPGLLSFSSLAASIISHLRSSQIPLLPGLSDSDFALLESHFNFSFPPDLRALLSLALPAAPGFPDWRSLPSLRAAFDLPLASASLLLTARRRHRRRSSSSDPQSVLSAARSDLRRAPLLIPLFGRCYLPCRPALAGNPVFFVDDARISCCGFDLPHFFRSDPHSPSPTTGTPPRHIEFWSDAAAADRRRRKSSASASSSSSSERTSSSSTSLTDSDPEPEGFLEIRPPKRAGWVKKYLDRMGLVLREGGWGESEVREMVDVAACGGIDGGQGMGMDGRMGFEMDRWSGLLTRGGWKSEDVADLLRGLDSSTVSEGNCKMGSVKLPSGIRFES